MVVNRQAGFIEAGVAQWALPALPRLLAVLALLAVGNLPADANPGVRFSGFGTLGYAADSRTDIAPYRDISQLPKEGFATGPGWELDSRIGLQLEYALHPMLDLVGQIVVRDHFKANLNSSTELAYAALRPNSELDVRIGRINYDAFLMSDHRNVGYTYTWVRPPLEFYGWIPIFSLDGIDAAYRLQDDTAVWRIKAQTGKSQLWLPVNSGIGGGYQFKTNNLTGLSVTRQAGSWRLKAAHSRFTVDSEIPLFAPLHAGLDQVAAAGIPAVSAEAADLRKNLSFQGARIKYTTLGGVYDDNLWLAQAELGYSSSTVAVVPTSRMAYASIGRRFGDWLPFIMLGTSRPGAPRSPANDWGTTLNASLRDRAVQTVNAMRIEQNTVSIGARWDFHPQAALKLQWDSTRSHPPGYGVWMRSTEIVQQSIRLNLVSATLDFIF